MTAPDDGFVVTRSTAGNLGAFRVVWLTWSAHGDTDGSFFLEQADAALVFDARPYEAYRLHFHYRDQWSITVSRWGVPYTTIEIDEGDGEDVDVSAYPDDEARRAVWRDLVMAQLAAKLRRGGEQ